MTANQDQEGRLFVGGISWKADEASLSNFFSSFGKVTECRIIMDKVTGKSKGYAFVSFENPQDAEKVKQSNNLYFLGKMMNVGDAHRRGENDQPKGNKPQQSQQYGGYPNGDRAPTQYQPPLYPATGYMPQNYQQQQHQLQSGQPNYYPQQLYANQGMAQYSPYDQANYQQGWQPMPSASSSYQASPQSQGNQYQHQPANLQMTLQQLQLQQLQLQQQTLQQLQAQAAQQQTQPNYLLQQTLQQLQQGGQPQQAQPQQQQPPPQQQQYQKK